jgi:hypothetical protein
MLRQEAKKNSEGHVPDNQSDDNAPLIEPASVIYLVNQYKRVRKEKKSVVAVVAEKISDGFKTVKETAQYYFPLPKSKNNEEEIQRDRDKICDELIKLSYNVNSQNILEYLFKAGNSADKIQQMKEQQWVPSTSDFMELMHGIRTLALWKIFFGNKITPRQIKEEKEFAEVIKKNGDILLDIIDGQARNILLKQGFNLSKEQKEKFQPSNFSSIAASQKDLDNNRYKAAYLGHTEHVGDFHVRNALWHNVFYHPGPNYDYKLPILELNFAAVLMRKYDPSLASISDDHIVIKILEDKAKEEVEKAKKELENELQRIQKEAEEKEKQKQEEMKKAQSVAIQRSSYFSMISSYFSSDQSNQSSSSSLFESKSADAQISNPLSSSSAVPDPSQSQNSSISAPSSFNSSLPILSFSSLNSSLSVSSSSSLSSGVSASSSSSSSLPVLSSSSLSSDAPSSSSSQSSNISASRSSSSSLLVSSSPALIAPGSSSSQSSNISASRSSSSSPLVSSSPALMLLVQVQAKVPIFLHPGLRVLVL